MENKVLLLALIVLKSSKGISFEIVFPKKMLFLTLIVYNIGFSYAQTFVSYKVLLLTLKVLKSSKGKSF